MYAYALGNPLSYVDPDGRDAVLVNFSKMAVGMGHQAIISVHKDGSATFAEYGPMGGSKPIWLGHHNTYPMETKIVFGPNGKPTDGSYASMIREVASKEGQTEGSVSLAYYKTSDADTLLLDQLIDWTSSGWSAPYVVGFWDCRSYALWGLKTANVSYGNQANLDVAPNLVFDLMLNVDDRVGEKGRKVDPEFDRKKSHKDCLQNRDGTCVQ